MESANRTLKRAFFDDKPAHVKLKSSTILSVTMSHYLWSVKMGSLGENRDCCYQCCWITMYKAGAFDYKMSFLCALSFIFVSIEDNRVKIKGLDFALTAITTKKSHGHEQYSNIFGWPAMITISDHVCILATFYTHTYCVNKICACSL